MKKAKKRAEPDMRTEYDFRDGARGKYAARFAAGTNIVILSPDVARHFPDSRSVNDALRKLLRLSKGSGRRPAR